MTTTTINKVNLSDIKEVSIVAKRWFQKSYGNTYHSVVVSVVVPESVVTDETKGSVSNAGVGLRWIDLAIEDFTYGYDNQYEQTALNLFKKAVDGDFNDLDNVRVNYLRTACQMLGITYTETVYDVNRKKDL